VKSFPETLEKRLQEFSRKKGYEIVQKISKGYSSEVFKAKKKNRVYALKIEKNKSPRINMIQKEKQFLELANTVKVGPKVKEIDLEKGIIVMQFIEGVTLKDFVFSNPKKRELEKAIDSLQKKAVALDRIGLDHGQLGGKAKNILVKKNGEAEIIDFEKASICRKAHNLNVIKALLFHNKNSALAKKIKECTNQK
jgi:predicted Ser/Thr protein kinase